jgi:hypothetical protein
MKTGGNQYLLEPGTVFSLVPPIQRFQKKHTQGEFYLAFFFSSSPSRAKSEGSSGRPNATETVFRRRIAFPGCKILSGQSALDSFVPTAAQRK